MEMGGLIDSAFKIVQNEIKLSGSALNNLVNIPVLLLPSALVFSVVSYLHIAIKELKMKILMSLLHGFSLHVIGFCFYDKYQRYINLKEWFILAHGFRDLSLWLAGSVANRLVGRQCIMVKCNAETGTYLMVTREQGEQEERYITIKTHNESQ